MDLQAWNYAFANLKPAERLDYLYLHFDPSEVLFTSSFGTTSAVLLHLIAEVNPKQKVHFINTGYLFDETIQYRNQLTERLGLEVVEVNPDPQMAAVTRSEQTWISDPDLCCTINKVMPLDDIKGDYKIWLTGLMGHQSRTRANFQLFEHGETIKFNVLVDFGQPEIDQYFAQNDLPLHPLMKLGYQSVGCTHCTRAGKGRSGRWQGQAKTECGLHTARKQPALLNR
ncbi:MAG: phosphoadenylyl-sulfate reductase [Bacteroidota bacterium]